VGLWDKTINPLNAELNPICHLLALLGAHHILHVSRIRVNKHPIQANAVQNFTTGWFLLMNNSEFNIPVQILTLYAVEIT